MCGEAGRRRCGAPVIQAAGPPAGALLAALHEEAFPPAERWDVPAMGTLLAMQGVVVGLATGHAATATGVSPPVPLGFVMGRMVADEAEILTLAVSGAARRRGLGRALLDWLAAQVAARGASRLILEVSDRNHAAHGLYRAAGFTEIGRRRAYYPDGSDAFVLARALDGTAP
jgi:[ribosomal protein S18]-alanine N-acetyltransferase